MDGQLPLDAGLLEKALRRAHADGRLDLPLPGSGQTWQRWLALAELAATDLNLARLAEAHTDAVAILAELAGPEPDGLWGVWAAEAPGATVQAELTDGGWSLTGQKAWCSGALLLDHALITAREGEQRWLFAVDVKDLAPVPGTWAAVGMATSQAVTVRLDRVRATPVGAPGSYLSRPGFWHGGAGVAACWYGGALGAGPLCRDAAHAQRAADLPVYVRQSHAERDLAGLGALASDGATW